MHAFLGTHLSYLGCLSRTVNLLVVIERESALVLLFVVSFMFISTSGSSMLSWANTSAACVVCLDLMLVGNKGRGTCYPVCGMMHIKEPLLVFSLAI